MSASQIREEAVVPNDEPAAVGPGSAPGDAPARSASEMSARSAGESTGVGEDRPAERSADPRAVRVTLAATSRLDADPTITVGPPPVAIEPLRDQLAGLGILGGAPAAAAASDTASSAVPGAAASATPVTATPVTATDRPAGGDPPAPEPATGPSYPLVDGRPTDAHLEWLDDARAVLVRREGGRATRTPMVLGPVRPQGGGAVREVVVDGWRFDVVLESERRAALRERSRRGTDVAGRTGPLEVRAIIPGRIVAVPVAAGFDVVPGQVLLVLEAMKMQNELRAPREGTIERVAIAVGVNVEVGDLLMVIT